MSATTLMLTVEPGVLDARSSWSEFESLAVQMSREVGLRALEATLADAQERLIDSVCGPRWSPVRGLAAPFACPRYERRGAIRRVPARRASPGYKWPRSRAVPVGCLPTRAADPPGQFSGRRQRRPRRGFQPRRVGRRNREPLRSLWNVANPASPTQLALVNGNAAVSITLRSASTARPLPPTAAT